MLQKSKSLLSLIGLSVSLGWCTALMAGAPVITNPENVIVRSNVAAQSNIMFATTELTEAKVEKKKKSNGKALKDMKSKVKKDLNAEIYRLVFKDRKEMEQRVKKALRKFVGAENKPIKMTLVPEEPAKFLSGHFKEIIVEIEGAVVKTLRMEYAWARSRNCSIDWEKLINEDRFSFKDGGDVDLLLKVTEKDVNVAGKKKSRKLKVRNPHMDFRPGHLRFSGGLRFLFFRNFVKVAGVLSIRGKDKVHFHPRWMNLDFLPVPGFLIRTISKRINPIATFESFKFRPNLSIIETTHDALYVASESMRKKVEKMVAEDLAARKLRLKERSKND